MAFVYTVKFGHPSDFRRRLGALVYGSGTKMPEGEVTVELRQTVRLDELTGEPLAV